MSSSSSTPPPASSPKTRTAALATCLAAWIFTIPVQSADVFTDTFTRADVDTGTATGSAAIGNGWVFHSDFQATARGGARIAGGVLQLGQTSGGGYAGPGGSDRSWLTQNTTAWPAEYKNVLANNAELVIWTFNIRTGQSNPTPVSTSGGGTAVFVLATAEPGSGDWQFGANAKGYIVTWNDASTADPIKLIRMANGTRNESGHTALITGSTAPFNDLSSQYLSVRVSYDPASSQWALFARNDGNSAFADPGSGSLTPLGTAFDGTYTSEALPYMGLLGNSNNGTNGTLDDLRFDNVRVNILTALEPPLFSPAPGTYNNDQTVTLSSTTAGASIRYTLDGTDPTSTTGLVYNEPISISTATTTVKAIAFKDGLADSTVATSTYSIQAGVPVFNPAAGTYPEAQFISLFTPTAGAEIRYTTDGSTPTATTGTLYESAVEIGTTSTLKAIAYRAGIQDSGVATAAYVIQTGTPVFSPPGGVGFSSQTVTLSSGTGTADIRYTTDGSDPSRTTGTLYTGPLNISTNTTLKAIAYSNTLPDSPVATATYRFLTGAGLVFGDDFSREDINTGTTTGSTELGKGWTFHSDAQTPVRGGARIAGGELQIGQTTANDYAGNGGADRSWVWQDTSTWPSPWTTTLASNPATVAWSFNMRTGQSNPTPVSTSGGGTAVAVLACADPGSADWQFGGTDTGYIVTYNDAGTTDPLKLIRMQNGTRNEANHTALITAGSSPFNDLSTQSLSVLVTYEPATHLWSLYAQADNGFFSDPRSGTLPLLGMATSSLYTNTPLPYMGFLGNSNNGFNGSADDLRFDNVLVTLETAVTSAYAVWSALIPTPADRGRTSDPDGDGLNNGSEFLFGTLPTVANGSPTSTNFAGGNIVLSWLQRESGAAYQVKESTTLLSGSWTIIPTSPVLAADQNGVPSGYDRYAVTITPGSGKRFFRVEAAESNP